MPYVGSMVLAPAHRREARSTRSQPLRSWGRLVIPLVFSLALLVRLAPLLWTSALKGESGQYDDGVYFAAAQHLVSGRLPYRDFVLLHPPGIALAMAPFAALGHLIGDADAFAAGRILFVLVGGVNAALVAWIAGRQGRIAGAAGGLLYAVWWPAVGSETTVFLEPILNLLLLLAVGLLTRHGPSARRPALAGVLMGASVGFKLWPAPVLLLLVVWLFHTYGLREVRRFAAGCSFSLLAVFGPFFVAAPRQMWTMVIVDQITRSNIPSPEQSISDRLLPFAGASDHLDNVVPAAGAVLMAAVVVVTLLLLVRTVPHGWLWWSILCMQVAELLLASTYYGTHYPAFAAASAAVLFGFAVGRAIQLTEHRVKLRFSGVLTVMILLVLFVLSSVAIGVRRGQEAAVDGPTLRSFTHAHRCVFTPSTIAIISDQEIRNIKDGCNYQIDLFGLLLDDNRAGGAKGKAVSELLVPSWQRHVREELGRSDAAILADRYATWQTWTDATRRVFLTHFEKVGQVGSLQLWSERR